MLHGHFARPIESKHRANAVPQWFEKSHLQLRVPNLGWAHRASKHVAGPSTRGLMPAFGVHHRIACRLIVGVFLASEGTAEKYQPKYPAILTRAVDIRSEEHTSELQ